MAALTSGSWTVLLLHATGEASNSKAHQTDITIGSRHKFVNAILVLTTGESPAAGIPWPDKGKLGFVRNLDSIILHNVRGRTAATVGPITASGQHITWTMNTTGQKARAFKMCTVTGTSQRAWVQLGTGITITGGQRFYVTAMGW